MYMQDKLAYSKSATEYIRLNVTIQSYWIRSFYARKCYLIMYLYQLSN